MQISAAVFGLAALTSTLSTFTAAVSLPWDGRANGLTVDKLSDKFVTKVLTQRKGEAKALLAEYVTIKEDARSPAYNGDTGVIDIGANSDAIWGAEAYSRRSDLMQNFTTNSTGTIFFRASVTKNETFRYPCRWQVVFPKSQHPEWSSEFDLDTWYNFGIGLKPVASGKNTELEFYTSTGDDDLVLNATTKVAVEFPSSIEMHWGLLTQAKQSKTATGPLMTKKQEVMSFNGISAENAVVTAAVVGSFQASESGSSSVAGEAEGFHKTGQKSFTF